MIVTGTTRKQTLDEVGYVVWKDLLDPPMDLLPLFDEYDALIDDVSARLVTDGVIEDRYADLPLGRRVVRLGVETRGDVFRYTEHLPSRRAPRRSTPRSTSVRRCSACSPTTNCWTRWSTS